VPSQPYTHSLSLSRRQSEQKFKSIDRSHSLFNTYIIYYLVTIYFERYFVHISKSMNTSPTGLLSVGGNNNHNHSKDHKNNTHHSNAAAVSAAAAAAAAALLLNGKV